MTAKTAKKQVKSSFKKSVPAGAKKPAASGKPIIKKAVAAVKKPAAQKKSAVVKKSTVQKKPAVNNKSKKKIEPLKATIKTPQKKSASKPIAKKVAPKTIKKPAAKSNAAAQKKSVQKKSPTQKIPAKKPAVIAKKMPTKSASKNLNKATVNTKAKATATPLKKIVKSSDKKTSKPQAEAPKKAVATKKNPAAQAAKPAEIKKTVPAKKAESAPKVVKPAVAAKTSTPKQETVAKSKKSDSPKKSTAAHDFSDIVPSRKAKRGKHVRPSESIAFTIEDLDSYLERRENGTPISITKEIAISKKRHEANPTAAKPVVAPIPPKPANRKPLEAASIFDILGFNPVEVPTREKLDEQDVPRKWKKYYNLLIDLRKHHSAGVEKRSEEVMKRSVKEDSGDLSSYGQHLADAGSESFERDMTYNILSNEKEILAEIDEAIKRIKNGTYGICEVTGTQIPDERLTAIPFTRFTKEGQERKELEQKRIRASQRNVFDIPDTAAGGDDDSNSQ